MQVQEAQVYVYVMPAEGRCAGQYFAQLNYFLKWKWLGGIAECDVVG